MKKSLSNLFKGLVLVLAIVSFCMMFCNQLKYVLTVTSIVSTETVYKFNEIFFGTDTINAAPLGFIGYILVLAGGLLTFCSVFLNNKKQHGLIVCLATLGFVCLVTGSVFIPLIKSTFQSANDVTFSVGALANGKFEVLAGPIIASIASCVASLLSLISLILDLKKSKK